MKEKITLHAVHCLISMLQISTINIRAMIGFSDVQELVIFQNFCFEKRPLA